MHLINLAHFWDDFPKKLVHQDVFRLDEIHLGIDVCDVALFILQSLKSEVCVCVLMFSQRLKWSVHLE